MVCVFASFHESQAQRYLSPSPLQLMRCMRHLIFWQISTSKIARMKVWIEIWPMSSFLEDFLTLYRRSGIKLYCLLCQFICVASAEVYEIHQTNGDSRKLNKANNVQRRNSMPRRKWVTTNQRVTPDTRALFCLDEWILHELFSFRRCMKSILPQNALPTGIQCTNLCCAMVRTIHKNFGLEFINVAIFA